MTKQNYVILGIILIIVLVLAGAVLVREKRQGTVTPAPIAQPPVVTPPIVTPPIIPTLPTISTPEGWKTYRNEEFGFEIMYPSDWRYREINGNEIFIEKAVYSEGSGFAVEIKIVDKLSSDVHKKIIEQYGAQIILEGIVNFFGKNIQELNIDSILGDDYAILIVPKDPKTFIIKRGLGVYASVHNQILSTFHFL